MKKNLEILYPQKKYRDLRELLAYSVSKYGGSTAFTIKHSGNFRQPCYENVSYADFGRRVSFLSAGLLNRLDCGCNASSGNETSAGITSAGRQNHRIAILGRNSCSWAMVFFAAAASGNTAVPLDRGLPTDEIQRLLIRSEAYVLFYDAEYAETVSLIKNSGASPVSLWVSLDDQADGADSADSNKKTSAAGPQDTEEHTSVNKLIQEGCRLQTNGWPSRSETDSSRNEVLLPGGLIDPDRMAVLLFTSGTTSSSKAVMLSHRNLCENVYAFTCCARLLPADTYLAQLPYHHTYGATAGLLSVIACGARTVFSDGLKRLLKNFTEYRVSVFFSVPLLIDSLYKKLTARIGRDVLKKRMQQIMTDSSLLAPSSRESRREMSRDVIDFFGGKLRLIMSGGGPADPLTADAFNAFGITAAQIYGLTETSPAVAIETEMSIRSGSAGRPMPGLDVRIADPDSRGIGEIAVKGLSVMLGYYRDPAATAKAVRDGWFYTGDLGYFDDDGFLFLCGRKKNVIVLKSGKNIYPEEIELLVGRLPYVAECLAYGARRHENDSRDQVLCVKVVYDRKRLAEHLAGITAEEHDSVSNAAIRGFIDRDIDRINDSLPKYKRIKRLIITDEPLVRTSTAKIRRCPEISRSESAV